MIFKNVFALAFVLCVCSFTSAQSFDLNEPEPFLGRARNQRAAVTRLPGDIFADPAEATIASPQDYEAEAAELRRVNTIVVVGLGGVLVAAVSGMGLLLALRKKSRSAKKGMQLVGV